MHLLIFFNNIQKYTKHIESFCFWLLDQQYVHCNNRPEILCDSDCEIHLWINDNVFSHVVLQENATSTAMFLKYLYFVIEKKLKMWLCW